MMEGIADYVYVEESRIWSVDVINALREINGHNMKGVKAKEIGARAKRNGKIRKLIWYYGV